MDEDFEKLLAAQAAGMAAVDQYLTLCKPMFRAIATAEDACRQAGMSDRAAALFAMRVADALNWPPKAASQ